jgi:hypothetical protein
MLRHHTSNPSSSVPPLPGAENDVLIRSSMAHWLSHAGDLAILLPLIAVIFLWSAAKSRYHQVIWWGVAVVLCMGVTAIAKVYMTGCPPASDLHSPSGHTSLSTLIYGAVVLLTVERVSRVHRMLVNLAGVSLILGIAGSRVGSHSVVEVIIGLGIGIATLTVFARFGMISHLAPTVCIGDPKPRTILQSKFVRIGLVSGIILLGLIGRRLHAEHLIQALTSYLNVHCD